MRKITRRALSLIIVGAMLLAMSAVTFADPTKTNDYTAGVIQDTRTVGVTLSKRTNDSSAVMVENDHTYTAVQILDLYKVMEADGTTQAVDSSGNLIYQYRSALGNSMSTSLQTLLASAGFKFDPDSGAITKSNNSAIATQVTIPEAGKRNGVNENTSDAAALAALIAQQVVADNISGTTMKLGTTTNLECGYWIIYESANSNATDGTVATKPILLDVRRIAGESGIALSIKDSKVELTKTITNDDTINQKQDTRSVGDVVSFKIESNFPIYEANALTTFTGATLAIEDTLDASLGLKANTIVVKVNDATVEPGSSPTVNYTKTTQDHKFVITFSQAYLMAHQGESIVITYDADLLKEAVINSEEGNKNAAKVTYSNNPEVKSSTKYLEDETQVHTFAFDLQKLDGAYDTHLAGCTFNIKDSSGTTMKFYKVNDNYYVYDSTGAASGTVTDIVTNTADITIAGLDEGTYTIHEAATVSGYSLLANDATITIDANEGTNTQLTLYRGQTAQHILDGSADLTVTNAALVASGETLGTGEDANDDTLKNGTSSVDMVIRNYKGIYLPETGSIAALVMTGVGIFTVLGGGAFVVARRKRDEE